MEEGFGCLFTVIFLDVTSYRRAILISGKIGPIQIESPNVVQMWSKCVVRGGNWRTNYMGCVLYGPNIHIFTSQSGRCLVRLERVDFNQLSIIHQR